LYKTKIFIYFFVVLPEQSTDVGDLIQPMPGVLYEDHRLKKGDPRRYQVNASFFFSSISIYTFFFDRLACQNTQISMMKLVH